MSVAVILFNSNHLHRDRERVLSLFMLLFAPADHCLDEPAVMVCPAGQPFSPQANHH